MDPVSTGMQVPFDITWGQVTIAGVILTFAGFGVRFTLNWWRDRRARRRERVRDWHKNMRDAFSDVRSVGIRLKTGRRNDVNPDIVSEVTEPAKELDARANPPPPSVLAMVDPNLRERIEESAGIAYHFAHLPEPDEDEDSIAGVMRHHYEILQELDVDTTVEIADVLDIISEVSEPDNLDITEDEATRILEDFEKEADQCMEDSEDMTVDQFMDLPWEKVDRVVSKEARQSLIQSSVEQYYEMALVQKPQEAKKAIAKSEENIF